ncbi:DNA-binding protein [Xanthomonas nasturtii]|nr:DNA-binding protein [Xanthomonas nasturtii]MCL1500318.1 DNA-binding protein [Xanthomonas nasturtii]MCL1504076.1 DNA-binding protein [Xanthomonas nasturtii]MCL1523953.1 DNA-binding protein [Xanthomonas nasturtii]MCL1560923.1 DNA-binding protein [Xanthomonas nasturtii]
MPRTATSHTIDLSPPKNVAQAAARGLKLRQQHGRGGTAIGVARARDLSAKKALSAQTIRRMYLYFARHSVDKNGKGWADAKAPSAGYIAWLLWGGDAGQRWAARLYQRLQDVTPKKGAETGDGSKKTATKKGSAKKSAVKKAAAKKVATTQPATKSVAKKTAVKKSATKKAAAGRASTKNAASSPVARKASKKIAKKTATKKTATKRPTTKKAPAKRGAAKKSASVASTATKAASKNSAPWNQSNPKGAARAKPLSAAQKTQARKRAKAAGRPYPNLVDNMAVASKRGTTKRATKPSAPKNGAPKNGAGKK